MMKKNFLVMVVMLCVIPGLLLTCSCAKKEIVDEKPAAGKEEVKADKSKADAEAAKRAEEERLRKEREEKARAAGGTAREKFVNEDVHFDYDKADIKADQEAILKDKAQFLKANADVAVVIEGHCDERGTAEYNIALGERRAQSTKKYMTNLGIAASRMETQSYGKERPIDPGKNEAAYAKNRRAHFVIK